MQIDDISLALDNIRDELSTSARAHHDWCHDTLPLLRDCVDRALAEGNEPLQEHLGGLLDRVQRLREDFQSVIHSLNERPLAVALGCQAAAEADLLRRLIDELAAIEPGLAALKQDADPACLVQVEDGDQGRLELFCWNDKQWPSHLPLSNALRAEPLPDHLLVEAIAEHPNWPHCLDGSSGQLLLAHDTKRVLAIAEEAPAGSESCPLDMVRQRLHRARLDLPAGDRGLFSIVDLLLPPAAPTGEEPHRSAFLRASALADSDLLLLPVRLDGDGDCGSAAFQQQVWQAWCERCKVDDDSRSLVGRFMVVVSGASQLFAHTERAPGDWLLSDDAALGARLARTVFNHLLGYHDQGPEAWPPLVLVDDEQQPPTIEEGSAAEVLEAFVQRFNEVGEAPADADDTWPESWRQAWRVMQGLWAHPQFQRNTARRARSWRRCSQALLAFMDPADRGWARLQRRLASWCAAGPLRLQQLDGIARAFDRCQEVAIELSQELRVRDLHDYDLEQIQQAAAFLRESNAYDPLELGFRFGERQAKGLDGLREAVLLQQSVRPGDVLQAVTQDTIDRLPLGEDMNDERATEGKAQLLAALRSLIELDSCWRSFRDDYIGPKDLLLPTLVEAAQLVWQRCDAVFEWLLDLGDKQPDANLLQDGERLPVAIDRHLREANVPALPEDCPEQVDRALQDLMMAAHNAADDDVI